MYNWKQEKTIGNAMYNRKFGKHAKTQMMRGCVVVMLLLSMMLAMVPEQRVVFAQSTSNGIWISKAELMKLPTSGSQWDEIKKVADTNPGDGNIGDQDSKHDI